MMFSYCSVVITELPPEHAKKALELVCLPSVSSLQVSLDSIMSFVHVSKVIPCMSNPSSEQQEITAQGGVAMQQLPARQLTVHIDRLACIFR